MDKKRFFEIYPIWDAMIDKVIMDVVNPNQRFLDFQVSFHKFIVDSGFTVDEWDAAYQEYITKPQQHLVREAEAGS